MISGIRVECNELVIRRQIEHKHKPASILVLYLHKISNNTTHIISSLYISTLTAIPEGMFDSTPNIINMYVCDNYCQYTCVIGTIQANF